MQHLKNNADSEEVFQETYFKVHRYIMSYDPQKKAIVWLISIAKNATIDFIKSKMKVVPDSSILDTLAAKNQSDDQINASELFRHLIQNLTVEEAELITSRIFNDVSYGDIAFKLQITETNARQKVSRVIKKLKASFQN